MANQTFGTRKEYNHMGLWRSRVCAVRLNHEKDIRSGKKDRPYCERKHILEIVKRATLYAAALASLKGS
ncbi:hypothetical protein ACFSVM_25550 [Paenibacillus shunpengii]|uniref:Uncharacterized protein n=1 Tax=Paenibacillus shunpengii TaxID=2054424 RepID=A0ABW5SXA8_9BACL